MCPWSHSWPETHTPTVQTSSPGSSTQEPGAKVSWTEMSNLGTLNCELSSIDALGRIHRHLGVCVAIQPLLDTLTL